MDLPVPLRPWARELSIFPPDIALSVGPLVQRLATLVGTLGTPSGGRGGEPDGYDGVSRRGHPERMLLTDLLLADEVPDEFIRRAVAGELGYLQLSTQQPRAARRSVVLLDAGPFQLGTPRIAHLAALIMFARRSEAPGVPFGWGVLQRPEQDLQTVLTEEGVMGMLHARGRGQAVAGHLSAWEARLGAWSRDDDVWLVGDGRVGTPPISSLIVEDPPVEELRELRVHLRRSGHHARTVILPLPDDTTCTRLIRRPFEGGRAAPSTAGAPPSSNLVFSQNGRWIFARGRASEVIVYPARAEQHSVEPVRLRAVGHEIVAVGRFKQRCVAVACNGDEITVLRADRRGRLMTEATIPNGVGYRLRAARADAPLQPIIQIPQGLRKSFEFCAVDEDGVLLEFGMHAKADTSRAKGVVGIGRYNGALVMAVAEEGGKVRLVAQQSGMPWRDLLIDDALPQAIAGPPARGHHVFGLWAVRIQSGWRFVWADGMKLVSPPSGGQVVGVVSHPAIHGPALVIVEDDRSIVLRGANEMRHVTRATSTIVSATVSPTDSVIAYRTEQGEVVTWSARMNIELARYVPEAMP